LYTELYKYKYFVEIKFWGPFYIRIGMIKYSPYRPYLVKNGNTLNTSSAGKAGMWLSFTPDKLTNSLTGRISPLIFAILEYGVVIFYISRRTIS